MPRYRLTAGPDTFLWTLRAQWEAGSEFSPNRSEVIAGDGDDVIIIDNNLVGGGRWGIWGEGGNDFIQARRFASADTLGGNDGNDTIIGGEGDDIVWGDAGNDSLVAGPGRDTLYGGDGDDWLGDGSLPEYYGAQDEFWGGAGNDTLQAGGSSAIDTLWGEAGNDLILGGSNAYLGFGGEGDDSMFTGQGGRGGDSTIGGVSNSDTLWGGAGNDRIENGYSGTRNRLDGEGGNDTIVGSYNDTAHGGAGDDRIEGAGEQWGWDGNDRLIAGSNSGSSRLRGGFGDDTLEGGDSMWGGEGRDTIIVNSRTGWGEAGDDTLIGGGASFTLVGMDGNDLLIGANGAEFGFIIGGRGNDTIQASDQDRVFTSWFEIAAGERDVVYASIGDARFRFEPSMAQAMSLVAVSGGAAFRIDTGGGTSYEMFVAGWSVADLQVNYAFF